MRLAAFKLPIPTRFVTRIEAAPLAAEADADDAAEEASDD
jgi:hypothetical protein